MDGGDGFGLGGGDVFDGGDGAAGIELPFGEETVGWQIIVERACGDAVEIRDVGADDGAESIEVEVSVADFEGIEGPFDETDVAGEGFFALEEFEETTDFAVAVGSEDSGHVRVEVGREAMEADDGHGEADHEFAIEGSDDLAAGLVGDDEHGVGRGFEIGFAPDEALDFYAAVEVREGGEFADLDWRGHWEKEKRLPQRKRRRRRGSGELGGRFE